MRLECNANPVVQEYFIYDSLVRQAWNSKKKRTNYEKGACAVCGPNIFSFYVFFFQISGRNRGNITIFKFRKYIAAFRRERTHRIRNKKRKRKWRKKN